MNTSHTLWTPHDLISVAASQDEPRKGFVGRAVAMFVDGTECIVMARNDADLLRVGNALLFPQHLDASIVYKATLIHSSGIEVVVPEPKPETPPAAPIVPEVPPTPAPVQSEVPVRPDDGVPVVTYKTPAVEDDDEL